MSDKDRLSAEEIVLAARYADAYQQERTVELASRRSLDRSPRSNWVEESGDLPGYIREIARALERDHGMPLSRAIPTAISRVKRWARGGGNVKADTRAKAAKAVAQWEALKAKNKARMAKKVATSDDSDDVLELSTSKRRVRTPGGAEHFDQPIGATIVSDVPLPTGRLTKSASRGSFGGASALKAAKDEVASSDPQSPGTGLRAKGKALADSLTDEQVLQAFEAGIPQTLLSLLGQGGGDGYEEFKDQRLMLLNKGFEAEVRLRQNALRKKNKKRKGG